MWKLTLLVAIVLAAVPAAGQPAAFERQRLDEAQQAYERGQGFMRDEMFEEAAAHFRTAIGLDPAHWLAYYDLGQSQMALKRYSAAVEAYLGCREALERVASLDAQDQNVIEKVRDDEIRELKDSLQKLETGKIKTTSPFGLEVRIQDRLRMLEDARLRGKEKTNRVPAGLMLALGSAFFRAGRTAEAEKAYVEAAQIDPKLGSAHNNLAVIYMMAGRFDEAREEIRRAEKSGLSVSDQFKEDLKTRARAAAAPR